LVMAAATSRCPSLPLPVPNQLDPIPSYRVKSEGMRIGEAAERAGVNIQTLRYYERRRLLAEPERSESGYRAYTPDDVRVVRFIKQAQELGFTLTDVAALIRLSAGVPRSCNAVRKLAHEK
jgi:DNA-binding transcriptional MerR regulator